MRHAFENLAFFVAGRIVYVELEHEAVNLCFGEGIGAFLFNRVFGRHHQEGLGEREGFVADGHLMLLHGFEQGALHFGGCAVDFVRENDVGEDGPFFGEESGIFWIVNQRSDQVGGKQVGRELDALKTGFHRGGEGVDSEGFCQAGNPFEQDVSVGKDSDDESVDEIFLPHNDFCDFSFERGDECARFANVLVYGFKVCHGKLLILDESERCREYL